MKAQYALYTLAGPKKRYAIRKRVGPFGMFKFWVRWLPSSQICTWEDLGEAKKDLWLLVAAEEARRLNRLNRKVTGWLP